jgi:hypothetical protein
MYHIPCALMAWLMSGAEVANAHVKADNRQIDAYVFQQNSFAINMESQLS